MSMNAEVADILMRGGQDYEGLDALEKMRFNLAMSSFFRNMENLHSKYRNGAIDEDVWLGWANRTLTFLTGPGTRRWWELNAAAFSIEFQRFIASPPPSIERTETFWPKFTPETTRSGGSSRIESSASEASAVAVSGRRAR